MVASLRVMGAGSSLLMILMGCRVEKGAAPIQVQLLDADGARAVAEVVMEVVGEKIDDLIEAAEEKLDEILTRYLPPLNTQTSHDPTNVLWTLGVGYAAMEGRKWLRDVKNGGKKP